jgi:hypothetical protein
MDSRDLLQAGTEMRRKAGQFAAIRRMGKKTLSMAEVFLTISHSRPIYLIVTKQRFAQ